MINSDIVFFLQLRPSATQDESEITRNVGLQLPAVSLLLPFLKTALL